MSARIENQAVYMQTRTGLGISWPAVQRVLVFLISAALLGWGFVKLQQPETLPIGKIRAMGEFKNVNEEMLRQVVAQTIQGGYFAVNVTEVKTAVEKLPWVLNANVSRIWPDTIAIEVTEQQALAMWNGGGLVNQQGALFVPAVETFPRVLPIFEGPFGMERNMTEFYKSAKQVLDVTGLAIQRLTLDSRGAYTISLGNGIQLLLGRENTQNRLERFARVFNKVLVKRADEIARIDMRYSNGLAVGWRNQIKN